ncbi:MAG: leucine-rich repeat domain-containing protein, partial [Bacteroidaceae bacterium]|nr:leucine-rich repeat domain-containing protein [Bacteroidaceae bacterium]
MQKMKLWMLAAILVCGASVFTSCSDDDDDVNMPTFLQPGDKWDAETGTLYVNSNPGKNAYREQTDIVSVVLSDAVTSIGDSAFYNCHVSVIDLPASVVSIGSRAFAGKKSDLEIVTILATDCTFGEHPFFQSILTNIYVPAESLASYKANHPDYASHFYAIPEVQQEGNEIIWSQDLCGYIWVEVPYYHKGKIVAAHNTHGGISVTFTGTEVENGFNWASIYLAQGEKLTFTSTVGNISQITVLSASYDEDEDDDDEDD